MTKIGIEKIGQIDIYFEHYQSDASYPTLVLLHGFLSSSFSYRKLIPYLTNRFNVIALDLPPFGKSGKIYRYIYSFENIAQSIIYFLEKRGLKSFTIIGHSMGGQIALQLTKIRPDLIERAILLCSSGYLPSFSRSIKALSYLPFFSLGVKYYLGKSGLEQNLQNVVYNQELIDDTMRYGYLQPFTTGWQIFRAMGRMVRDKKADLLKDDLNKIHRPCLLIWGREDKVVPLQIGERLASDLPHSELVILDHAGHLLPEEQPEKISQLIHDFFKENSPMGKPVRTKAEA